MISGFNLDFANSKAGVWNLLSRWAQIVDYHWRAANNNWLYPKILPLSYYEG